MHGLQIDKADKRKVLFVKNVGNIPTVISKRPIKVTTEQITFKIGTKKLSFDFDINKPSYRYKNIYYYVIDISTGQLSFKKPSKQPAPELLHAIFRRQIIKQLVSGLEKGTPAMTGLMIILMCAGLFFLFGYLMGQFFPMSLTEVPITPIGE